MKHDEMEIIGQRIIEKVRSVFVFGPGNAQEHGIGDKYHHEWATAIQDTGRFVTTMSKEPASTKDQPIPGTDYFFARLNFIGGSSPFDHDMQSLGMAYAARIGNCGEHASLGMFFALQFVDENNNCIFDSISKVSLRNQDHSLVKVMFGIESMYIDPWKGECYYAEDFSKYNNGQTADIAEEVVTLYRDQHVFELFAGASNNAIKSSFEEFYVGSSRWIDIFLLAINVPPEELENYIAKAIDEENGPLKKYSYVEPDVNHPIANKLFKMLEYNQKQKTAKENVIRQLKEYFITSMKDRGLGESDMQKKLEADIVKEASRTSDKKIDCIDYSNKKIDPKNLIDIAIVLHQKKMLDENCRIIFSADNPLVIGKQKFSQITPKEYGDIMRTLSDKKPESKLKQ